MTLPLMTRRAALIAGGAVCLAGSAGALTISKRAGDRKFVLVILRGAMDGLAAAAPFGDPHYRAARGKLALAAPGEAGGGLPLTEGFGLHPNLAFLHDQWTGGELAILPACASPYRERSHFDAQDVLESGASDVFGASDGWLGRALSALPPGEPREAVAISGALPLVLRGSASATSWAPSFAPSASDDTLARLMDLYAGDTLLGPALASAIETNAIAAASDMDSMGGKGGRAGPGAYKALAEAAGRLMSADGGPAAAVLSFDGWDTHANQGAANGQLALRLAGLDAALRALKDNLGPHWENTVVSVVTEFGRTVAENGTGGTDHGTGSTAFLLGGSVDGGKFAGDWPGLAPKALYEGRDLAPANDLRAMFMAVLQDHWGLGRSVLSRTVFPDAGGLRPMAGLVRT
ncbi:DUF1501 domain-containing protein [Hyphomonas sp.]|uniref:DUF1501 domain-containing protein n=1 Tax=Hyphomonas sp. TaxID=87 RepID=UPI00391CABD7